MARPLKLDELIEHLTLHSGELELRTLEGDHSSGGLTARALASADGGDPGGAAQLYERAGQLDVAARQHELAGDFPAAARCWRRHLGDDAVESADFVRCLYRVRAFHELVNLCAEAIERKGQQTQAVAHLRELLQARVHSLDPDVEQAARAAVDSVSSQDRAAFERQVPLWVGRARAEIDRRFAGVWGLDLGTTTCVAAIYDNHLGRAVSCPWRGHNQSKIGQFRLEGIPPAKMGEPKIEVTFDIDDNCVRRSQRATRRPAGMRT